MSSFINLDLRDSWVSECLNLNLNDIFKVKNEGFSGYILKYIKNFESHNQTY